MTVRLDARLAEAGLARSRSHAATLIADGRVRVDGAIVRKPAHRIAETAGIDVIDPDPYVSRGAYKLLAALDGWPIEVTGRIALDMGASTGGFTQVLRARGAARVFAVDVGHGQLASQLRDDPAIRVVEGFNVRTLSPERLHEATGDAERPNLVTGDLSFISLSHVLPAVAATMTTDADVVLLVKPQFEVGRTRVSGGVVTEPAARADALRGVITAAAESGLAAQGIIASPIEGTHGNAEYLVWFRRGDAPDPTEWESTVNRLAGVE